MLESDYTRELVREYQTATLPVCGTEVSAKQTGLGSGPDRFQLLSKMF